MIPVPLLNLLTGPIFDTINKVIDRAWPDPAEAAKAKLKLLEMQQAGDFKEIDANLQLALKQMEVNAEEAKSGSAYAAGWRPTIGYIGAASLGYNFVLYPILNYGMKLYDAGITPPPMFDTGPLMTLVMGMLGIGVMRTWEKGKGVAS